MITGARHDRVDDRANRRAGIRYRRIPARAGGVRHRRDGRHDDPARRVAARLHRELVQLGVAFRTESDTEVLAAALQTWGADALRRLVGMYAFVAVDVTNGDFLAARDPFGVKPLYLINTGPGFLFCSEIRPLLSAAETGDVLLLPPVYLLTRMQCLPYDSAIAPSIVPSVSGSREDLDRALAEG